MKKIILFIALIINSTLIFAQSNESFFDFAFNTGGGFNNTKRLNYNSQGDLLFMVNIGDSTSFGGTPLKGISFGQYPGSVTFIGKRTQSGTKSVLIKAISGGSTIGNFDDFAIDGNDNIIVSGTVYNATIPYDFGNGVTLLGKGFFVAKYNSNGLCQWAKLFDLGVVITSTNTPVALGVLPNNDIYFATKTPNGNAPFWLIRLNENGTEIWHKEWLLSTGGGTVYINTSKNNCFFDNNGTAYFYVSNLNGNYLKVNNDSLVGPAGGHPSTVYLLSIDGSGNNKLLTAYRGGFGDIAVEKNTGNVILEWAQYSLNPAPFNTVNFNANNQYQGFVAIDSNRNYIQSTSTNFLGSSEVETIFPLGNLKFVGTNVLAPTEVLTAGTQTFTATKYTPTWKFFDSNFVFSKFVAHPELNGTSSFATPLLALYDNKLAVCGEYSKSTDSIVTVNGTSLTACENNLNFATKFPVFGSLAGDIFISQLTIGASTIPNEVSIINQTKNDFILFPNPSTSQFSINSKVSNYNIEISNALGQIIFSKQVNNIQSTIDISNFTKGIYYVTLKTSQESSTQKLIVE